MNDLAPNPNTLSTLPAVEAGQPEGFSTLPLLRDATWFLGSLVGIVTNHPAFPDGSQIKTSRVVYGPDACGLAQTRNTLYRVELRP